jgi:hypothetical protein
MKASKLFSALLCIGLFGCAKDVVLEKPSFTLSSHYKEFGDWVEINGLDQKLPDDWWKLFQDQNLNNLESLVDQTNPNHIGIDWSNLKLLQQDCHHRLFQISMFLARF